MMSKFTKLIKRFHHDQSGAFAIMFAVSAVSLIGLGGAAVDFASIEQVRSKAQQALDAATLALQQDIYSKDAKAEITEKAEDFIVERIGSSADNVSINIDDTKIDTESGSLYLEAHMSVPMYFVAILGFDNIDITISSQSIRKKNYLEVAFVLDNSGSMASSSRMKNLKTATEAATNILFYGEENPPSGAEKSDKTQIGIVPFAHFVNIGPEYDESVWMDLKGESEVSRENFDDDDNDSTTFTGNVNRFALYDSMKNTSWEGCVEARRGELSVDDTPPDSDLPNTLFVPVFSPDEPDSGSFKNSYIDDDEGVCTTNPKVNTLSSRERQERLCKYSGEKPSSSKYGPNASCLDAAILPLTDNVDDIIDEIDDMKSNGYTNIHQGVAWGMRILSPGAPFTEGRSYDLETSKVMIVMTDGSNTFRSSSNMNGSSYLSAYGHRWTERMGFDVDGVNASNSATSVMDQLTVATCENAKELGMTIYSIGLNVSNTNRAMLTACATSESHAHFPTASASLNDVFIEIAGELSELRIEN